MKSPDFLCFREGLDISHISAVLPPGSCIYVLDQLSDLSSIRINKRIPTFVLISVEHQAISHLLAYLKQHYPKCKLIGIASEKSSKEHIVSAFRAGISDVLIQPIDRAELKKRLHLKKFGIGGLIDRMKGGWAANGAGPGSSASDESEVRPQGGKILVNVPKDKLLIPLDEEVPAEGLYASFLGHTAFWYQGEKIAHKLSRRPRVLLAYLMLQHRKTPQAVLMDRFWGHASPESARNSLHNAISTIRKTFKPIMEGKDLIYYDQDAYAIHPDLLVKTDVDRFRRMIKRASDFDQRGVNNDANIWYRKAYGIYKGKFMADDPYEDWVMEESEQLQDQFLIVLDKLSLYHSNNGTPRDAIEYCHKILRIDNCMEDIHRRLMRCYYRLGNRRKAIDQYKKCEEILEEEFGGKPTPATTDLFEKILQNNVDLEDDGAI